MIPFDNNKSPSKIIVNSSMDKISDAQEYISNLSPMHFYVLNDTNLHDFTEMHSFKRYVQRVKEILNNFLKSDKEFWRIGSGGIYEFVSQILIFRYETEDDFNEREKDRCYDSYYLLRTFFDGKAIQNRGIAKILLERFKLLSKGSNDKKEINKIIEICFQEACRKYLKRHFCKNNNINIDNFIRQTLPQDYIEYYEILIDTARYVDSCVMFSALENGLENLTEDIKDKLSAEIDASIRERIESIESENSKLRRQLEDAQNDLKVKQQQIDKLRDTMSTQSDSQFDDLYEKYQELLKTSARQRKKYNSLADKYNRLKQSVGSDEEEVSHVEEPERQEFDAQGRYIFVVTEYAELCKNLLRAFPNSRIVSKFEKIDFTNVEAVIVITTHVTHKVYFHIKEQCQNRNIPFYHVSNTNVSRIKFELSKIGINVE